MNAKFFFARHKEVILFLLFGGLTTLVCLGSYILLRLAISVKSAQILSWAAAVLFAYVTNKIFVFESRQNSPSALAGEFLKFAAARVFTGALEFFFMALFVKDSTPKSTEMIIKMTVTIAVVILNYGFSKVLIFVRKK